MSLSTDPKQEAIAEQSAPPVPRPVRFPIDLSGIARSKGTAATYLMPHPDGRTPAEDQKSGNGLHVAREGYLTALRQGLAVLIVEDDRPILLMPPESAARIVSLYRWHLADYLTGKGFRQSAPTGGWSAVVAPWPLAGQLAKKRGLPGPKSGTEALLFGYRLLCMERDSGQHLTSFVKRITAAIESIENLSAAIKLDGRHHAGEPWPDLLTLLRKKDAPIHTKLRRYQSAYKAASVVPSAAAKALTVFWSWCKAGAPVDRYWTGWSGRLDDPEGPIAHGPLDSPWIVLWTPGWGLAADELAAVAAGQYIKQVPEQSPLLAVTEISFARLERQRQWLAATLDTARAIIGASVRLRLVPTAKGGHPQDICLRWFLQGCHRQGLSLEAAVELLAKHRDDLPDWQGIAQSAIKKRLLDSWERHIEAPPAAL